MSKYIVTPIKVYPNGDFMIQYSEVVRYESLEDAYYGTIGAYIISASENEKNYWYFLPRSEDGHEGPPERMWTCAPDHDGVMDRELTEMLKKGIPHHAQ